MESIYTSGDYLQITGSWHSEDSLWKAGKIHASLNLSSITPASVIEVGCGAGEIIKNLSKISDYKDCRFTGYDVSPQAIELGKRSPTDRCEFRCVDILHSSPEAEYYDLLLAIDVFEHVEDYIGFIRSISKYAKHKVFHVPLDVHVSSVLRGTVTSSRARIGHLRYFSAESALATIQDAGLNIISVSYTCDSIDLFRTHPSVKKAIANLPRFLVGLVSERISARIFGGYSLLVLAE